MPKFNVLSGTWYHIEAPNQFVAEEAYDAYFSSEDMPEGCKVVEGEVDSIWEDATDYVPPIQQMKDIVTPEPPKGFDPAW